MRHILFFLLFLLTVVTASAQQQRSGYEVRYYKDKLITCRDGSVGVIDVDLEWPEAVDYQQLLPLKRFLARHLFQTDETDLSKAYKAFVSHYGERVTKTFDTIPDDNKFCYATRQLHLVGYEPYRYISFALIAEDKPGKLSGHDSLSYSQLITYNLKDSTVNTLFDLLNAQLYGKDKTDNYVWDAEIDLDGNHYLDLHIVRGCPVSSQRFDLITAQTEDNGTLSYHTISVAPEDMRHYLTKAARKMLFSSAKPLPIQAMPTEDEMSIGTYNLVTTDSLGDLSAYTQALQTYISQHAAELLPYMPSGETKKTYVRAIIDHNGFVQEPAVLLPSSPDLDREVVTLLKGMPRITPYSLNGQARDVTIFVPFKFMKP